MYDDFPIKSKKRGVRRKIRQKKVEKAERIFESRYAAQKLNERYIRDWAVRHADNLKSCSCSLCRNKDNEKSLKEKIAEIDEKEQLTLDKT